eukprot:gene23341-30590_t
MSCWGSFYLQSVGDAKPSVASELDMNCPGDGDAKPIDIDMNCQGEVDAKPCVASELGQANDGAKQEKSGSEEGAEDFLQHLDESTCPPSQTSKRPSQSLRCSPPLSSSQPSSRGRRSGGTISRNPSSSVTSRTLSASLLSRVTSSHSQVSASLLSRVTSSHSQGLKVGSMTLTMLSALKNPQSEPSVQSKRKPSRASSHQSLTPMERTQMPQLNGIETGPVVLTSRSTSFSNNLTVTVDSDNKSQPSEREKARSGYYDKPGLSAFQASKDTVSSMFPSATGTATGTHKAISFPNGRLPSASGSPRRKESGPLSRGVSGTTGGMSTSSERNVEIGSLSMSGRKSVRVDLSLPETQGIEHLTNGQGSLTQRSLIQRTASLLAVLGHSNSTSHSNRSMPPKTASMLAVLVSANLSNHSSTGSLMIRRLGIPTRESFTGTMGGNLQAQRVDSDAVLSTSLYAIRRQSISSSYMEGLSPGEKQFLSASHSAPSNSCSLQGTIPSGPLAPLIPSNSGAPDLTQLRQARRYRSVPKAKSLHNLRSQANMCDLITEEFGEGA